VRQTSPFVSALLFLTGFFLLSTALIRGELFVAGIIFLLFFTFWLALQINRDPHLELQKTKRLLRIAGLIGVLIVVASVAAFAGSLIQGDYSAALKKLAPAILVSSIAWRYRKDWLAWLRTGVPATKNTDSQ
jgi:hypothetical protein